jgi:hypothetical protein
MIKGTLSSLLILTLSLHAEALIPGELTYNQELLKNIAESNRSPEIITIDLNEQPKRKGLYQSYWSNKEKTLTVYDYPEKDYTAVIKSENKKPKSVKIFDDHQKAIKPTEYQIKELKEFYPNFKK